uniref:Remorin C-terminal domain-containing protein n=1 Tax=Ananas comosus var. bracteatus TaxID=296719 RepID=A0A6V7NVF4_ANACO|nr:unnamed protein product [Ananas comosus var. bracteatus]
MAAAAPRSSSSSSNSNSRGLNESSAQRRRGEGRRLEAPPTPGRPIFHFTPSYLPKRCGFTWSFCRSAFERQVHRQCGTNPLQFPILRARKNELFIQKSIQCTDERCVDGSSFCAGQRREVGTEMTPFGSSTNSRSHTPIMSTSPARHNTPASRSGLLVPYNPNLDISELKDCHFAKLELSLQYDSVASNWSTREEEEEEISKSLRHFEISGGRKSGVEFRASAWEEEERAKSCIRYQREEAKIQAWVNLQNAKAEAQSRKLEVKIQKMKSNLEEKLMKRMAIVHRKAEEWRASAQLQHTQQLQKASDYAQKIRSSNLSGQYSCGCFPCNNNNNNHHHL